jgi:hypothetical protein
MKRATEKIILANEDFYCKTLNIGVSVDDIMAEVNVFDWMELRQKAEAAILLDFKSRLGFKNIGSEYHSIREKAFAYKFERAILNLSALVEEVNSSYNLPKRGGVTNPQADQYYYLKYWADKKCIAVDYNQQDYNKRKLFNFYTILFDIFATKLDNFNAYHKGK